MSPLPRATVTIAQKRVMVRPLSYFDDDCLPIVEFAQESPDNWARVATFVLLTIQQNFQTMPLQMADVDEVGNASRFLFLHKRTAHRYIHAHKRELHRTALRFAAGEIDLDRVILDYLAMPNFGIVKASFVAQMTVGDGACLDTHNLRAMGLSEGAFKTPKTLTVATVAKKITAYNAAWRAIGDSAWWWDSWCDAQAVRWPLYYPSGADASRLHRRVVFGGGE